MLGYDPDICSTFVFPNWFPPINALVQANTIKYLRVADGHDLHVYTNK